MFDRGLPLPDPPAHATFDVALQKPEGAKLGVEVLPVSEGEHCELAVRRITKGGVVDVWNQLAEEVSKILPGDRITKVNGISRDVDAMVRELQSSREIALLLTRRSSNISNVGPNVHGSNNAVANASSSNHAVTGNNTGGPTAINHENNGSYNGTANSNTSNIDANITQSYDDAVVVSFDVELEKRPGERLGMEVVVLTGDAFNGVLVDRILQGGCVDRWNMRSRSPYRIQSLDIIRVNGATATQGLLNTTHDFCMEAQRITFTVQRFANQRSGDRPAPTSVEAHRSRISNVLEGLVWRNASMTNDAPRQQPRDGATRSLAASLVPPPPPPVNARAPWSAPPPPCGDAAPPRAPGAGDATDGQPARPAVEPPIIPSADRSMPAEAGPPRHGMSLAQAVKMAPAPAPSAPPAPVFGNRGSSAAQPDAAAPTRKWVPKQPPEHKADDFTDIDASLKDSNDLSSSTQGSKDGDGQAEGSCDQSEDANEAEAAVAAAPAESPEAGEGGAAPSASARQDPAADEPAAPGASDPSDATGLAPGASAKLLFRTGQLDDEDFVRLLKTALSQRPGLSAFVARAIKLLKE